MSDSDINQGALDFCMQDLAFELDQCNLYVGTIQDIIGVHAVNFLVKYSGVLFGGAGIPLVALLFSFIAVIFGFVFKRRKQKGALRNASADKQKDTAIIIEARFPSDAELQQQISTFVQLKLPLKKDSAADAMASHGCVPVMVAEAEEGREFCVRNSEITVVDSKFKLKKNSRGRSWFVSPAEFLAWSDDGREIMVACDSQGIRRYVIEGDKLQCRQDYYSRNAFDSVYVSSHSCRYLPTLVCWGENPGYEKSLLFTVNKYAVNYLYIQVDGGPPKVFKRKSLYLGGLDTFYGVACSHSPWRPGKMELLCGDGTGRALSLVDIKLASNSHLLDSGIVSVVNFDSLLNPGYLIYNYAWHPSGKYVAITVANAQHEFSSRRVYIVHFNSGVIFSASEDHYDLLGWSDDGCLLLLVGGEHRSVPEDERLPYVIWNPVAKTLVDVGKKALPEIWLNRLISACEQRRKDPYSSNASASNASGTLTLLANESRIFINDAGSSTGFAIEHKGVAKWSPTDPGLLASVGEIHGRPALRLWRLTQREHGGLSNSE